MKEGLEKLAQMQDVMCKAYIEELNDPGKWDGKEYDDFLYKSHSMAMEYIKESNLAFIKWVEDIVDKHENK